MGWGNNMFPIIGNTGIYDDIISKSGLVWDGK